MPSGTPTHPPRASRQPSARQRRVLHSRVLSHAKITSADVNDIAITQKQVNSKPAPRLLIATEKGVYEVNFDPKICPKGAKPGHSGLQCRSDETRVSAAPSLSLAHA